MRRSHANWKRRGAHRLFDSRQIPDTIVDVLAVRADGLGAGRGEGLRHLVATHFRTLAFLLNSPEDAAARIGARRRADPVPVAAAYAGLTLPDLAENRRLLAGPSPVLHEKARLIADVMRRSGLLTREDDLSDLISSDYLPGADTEGAS